MKNVAVLLVAGLAGACSSSTAYVPEEGREEAATLGGRTAAQYQLPTPEDVQADVRIASFGFLEAKPKNRDEKVKALHLRMNVSSEGDRPLVIDTRKQVVEGPLGGRHVPGYVATDAGQPPEIAVPPGSSRTMELYYEVPPEYAKEADPKNFTLHWTVDVGGQTFTRSTPFQQVAVDPAVAQQEQAQNIAYENYWADPMYGTWSDWGPWGYWYR